jgi:type IV secretory pathway ATPase VirB11/archaellum biosynthesis ATPase
MIEKIKAALKVVAHSRHRLIVLVGDFGTGKTTVLKQLARELPAVYVNLNLELTDRLLTRPRRDYDDGVTVHGLIDELCDEHSPDGQTLLVDNVEMLFSPDLGKVNPVDTFKRMSRQRSIVLALPARGKGERADYSAIGRDDHMVMSVGDYTVFELP